VKIMGLDVGDRRVGVAVSDQMGIIAQGRPTLDGSNQQLLLAALGACIKSDGVEEIVVGLPLNMDGTEGPQAAKVLRLAELIKKEFNLPVKMWDERLSTSAVERMMIEADTSRYKRKIKIDKLAAQFILQGYLDSIQRKDDADQ